MSVLFLLVPLSVLMGIGAIAAFLWALKGGQFDDLQSPASRLVLDDDTLAAKNDNFESQLSGGDTES